MGYSHLLSVKWPNFVGLIFWPNFFTPKFCLGLFSARQNFLAYFFARQNFGSNF